MENKKTVKVGIIGLGPRAETLVASICNMEDWEAEISAICDIRPERIEKMQKILEKHGRKSPATYVHAKELIADPNVDAVMAPTSWNSHLQLACESMKAGKHVAVEVGGATSLDELWQLVHAAESTGVSCMMLENCCYMRNELMVFHMARKGMFGEIIHCAGGYEHYLAEMACTIEDGHERAIHNLRRCGDLYPTHQLGPIAKLLRINRGNRFLSLTSTASKARGFADYARQHDWKGTGPEHSFHQGDIITTVIKCAGGETVVLTHGVSLPRPYSRDGRVQGTRGIWMEDTHGIYVEGRSRKEVLIDPAGNPYDNHYWDPMDDYFAEFEHPIWKNYNPTGGHGGVDVLCMRAFFDSVRNGTKPPIDVYDCAAWMAVTCLSEMSIAMGSMPVAFPDFTNGKWIYPPGPPHNIWSLDDVYEGGGTKPSPLP